MTCRTACLVALTYALVPTGASALDGGEIAINGEVTAMSELAEAVAAASPGDRIELGSGTYGAIDIDRALTITGIDTGEGLPTIDGGRSRTAVTVSADGVTLESLHVTTSQAEPHQFGIFQSYSEEGCVVVRAGGATIRDSFLDGCHFGVYVLGATQITIADNSIERNVFGGIFIRNSQQIEVTGNSLLSNGWGGIDVGTIVFPPGSAAAFRNLARDVVLSEDARAAEDVLSEDIAMRDNSVIGHKLGGIGIGFARNVAVVNNVVTDNGGVPLPQSFPPVSKSTSSGVEGFGIALNCAAYENLVEANTVTNNINIGILLDGVRDIQVSANEVTGSENGIQLFGSYSNAIERNRVFANSGTGIRIERGANTNAPSVANLVVGNDLTENAENAFDTSGSDTAPASRGADLPNLPADLSLPNRWDDGTLGNHYDDFDEASEGFVDENADGISEAPLPIPGGRAVDHFPLDAERVATAMAEVAPAGMVGDAAAVLAALACPAVLCRDAEVMVACTAE